MGDAVQPIAALHEYTSFLLKKASGPGEGARSGKDEHSAGFSPAQKTGRPDSARRGRLKVSKGRRKEKQSAF